MPLDPLLKAFLDQMAAQPLPKMWEMEPAGAREAMVALMQAAGPKDVPIGKVTTLAIPGPAGDIPARAYTPVAAGGEPLPARRGVQQMVRCPLRSIVDFHGQRGCGPRRQDAIQQIVGAKRAVNESHQLFPALLERRWHSPGFVDRQVNQKTCLRGPLDFLNQGDLPGNRECTALSFAEEVPCFHSRIGYRRKGRPSGRRGHGFSRQ